MAAQGDLDAGIQDAGIQDAGIYVYPPAGLDPPTWLGQAELDAYRGLASAMVNITPLGWIKGGIEAFTGKDMFTGAELAAWERALNAAAVFGKVVETAATVHKGLDAYRTEEAVSAARDLTDAVTDLAKVSVEVEQAVEVAHEAVSAADTAIFLAKLPQWTSTGVNGATVMKALVEAAPGGEEAGLSASEPTADDLRTDADGRDLSAVEVDTSGDGVADSSQPAEGDGVDPSDITLALSDGAQVVDTSGDGIADSSELAVDMSYGPADDEPNGALSSSVGEGGVASDEPDEALGSFMNDQPDGGAGEDHDEIVGDDDLE